MRQDRYMKTITHLPFTRVLNRAAKLTLAMSLLAAGIAHAYDYGPAETYQWGPFTLNGFAKFEGVSTSNTCSSCQMYPTAAKDESWADTLVPGTHYGTAQQATFLVQPWLGAHFNLGKGFKLDGLYSQRWRNGNVDIPGFAYEENVALSHEDYGRLAVGAMTTRAWSLADYPYGTNLGQAYFWGASGAGYGLLLKQSARYTSRPFDVLEGDLVLESTYSAGATGWRRNKPNLWEFYGQYHRGDLVIDGVIQTTRNGTPSAWSHGPFTGLTPFPANDSVLSSSGQGVQILLARYQLNAAVELSGGVRHNHWSGANACIVVPATSGQNNAQWNNMFNVDWNADSITNSAGNSCKPAYAASSTDLMGGARSFRERWEFYGSAAYLGKGSTNNPQDRGQTNWALLSTVGTRYNFNRYWQVYGYTGVISYGHLGLAPLAMPTNSAGSNVDSRVAKTGNFVGLGTVYAF